MSGSGECWFLEKLAPLLLCRSSRRKLRVAGMLQKPGAALPAGRHLAFRCATAGGRHARACLGPAEEAPLGLPLDGSSDSTPSRSFVKFKQRPTEVQDCTVRTDGGCNGLWCYKSPSNMKRAADGDNERRRAPVPRHAPLSQLCNALYCL